MNRLKTLLFFSLGPVVYFASNLQASVTKVDISTASPTPIFRLEKTEKSGIKTTPKTYVWKIRKSDDQELINKWRSEKDWSERNFLVYPLTAQKDMTWDGNTQTYEVKSGKSLFAYVTFPVSFLDLFTLKHRGVDSSVLCLSDANKLTFSLYAPPDFTAPTLLEALLAEDARVHKAKSTTTALPSEMTTHKRLPSGYTWGDLLRDLAIG